MSHREGLVRHPKARPHGVTILTVLLAIGGSAFLAIGALIGVLGPSWPAAILLLIGLGEFAVTWGLWNRRGWARTAALILAILDLFNFPIGTIIGVAILVYLREPPIKAYFNR